MTNTSPRPSPDGYVDHGGRRAGLAANPLAVEHHQVMVDPLPGAVVAEPGEPAIGRRPGRELLRQHAPGNPTAQDIENGVDDLPHLPLAMTPAWTWRRQERMEDQPLGVGQVTSIA